MSCWCDPRPGLILPYSYNSITAPYSYVNSMELKVNANMTDENITALWTKAQSHISFHLECLKLIWNYFFHLNYVEKIHTLPIMYCVNLCMCMCVFVSLGVMVLVIWEEMVGARSCSIYQKYQMHRSVQFSRSVVSDTLRPHELQHTRPPCPSSAPKVYSNSCSSSRWCHPAISSSVVPFSSCSQSLPALGSFQMSQLFAWGGQSIGVSTSASVLPTNTQDWSPLGWTSWISLQSKGLSRVFSNTTLQKHQFFGTQLSL